MNTSIKSPISSVSILLFEIPCEYPESDGTYQWSSTTLIVIILEAENKKGMGYTYGDASVFSLLKDNFAPQLKNTNPFDNTHTICKLAASARNAGLPGIASHALSAADIALWDLKAKILKVPLCKLWGVSKEKITAYGSGGFTSYNEEQTATQFEGWQKQGIFQFKMKVGRYPEQDIKRVKSARKIIGPEAKLFVDANGAYDLRQALEMAEKFNECEISWFEEPVSADNTAGLNFIRNKTPPGMNVVAGEYGYNIFDFKKLLAAQAVDILQGDATRCGGYSGFFSAANLASAFQIPISSHTAPSIHLHLCLALPHSYNLEFFHDHQRIEEELFEGFPRLENGYLWPYLERDGHGLEIKKISGNKYLKMEAKI